MKYDNNFKLVIDSISNNKKAILKEAGMIIEGQTKLRCPVDTGNLRNSYNHRVIESEDKVLIGTNVDYAYFVEFGTSKQPAQPHLNTGFISSIKDIERLINDKMKL